MAVVGGAEIELRSGSADDFTRDANRKLSAAKGKFGKLLDVWVQSLAAAACGHVVQAQVVGQGGGITAQPMDTATAQAQMQTLLEVWLQGMQSPLPLPLRTALALANLRGEIAGQKPSATPAPKPVSMSVAEAVARTLGLAFIRGEASSDANLPMSLGIPAIAIGGGGQSFGSHTEQERFDTALIAS